MNPANSYENILQYLDHHKPGVWMCGLLFAPPKTKIGKSIMDRLYDWHRRSGLGWWAPVKFGQLTKTAIKGILFDSL